MPQRGGRCAKKFCQSRRAALHHSDLIDALHLSLRSSSPYLPIFCSCCTAVLFARLAWSPGTRTHRTRRGREERRRVEVQRRASSSRWKAQ